MIGVLSIEKCNKGSTIFRAITCCGQYTTQKVPIMHIIIDIKRVDSPLLWEQA